MADKEGRLEDRPLRVKAEVFPYREGLDVNGYLTQLERWGFIHRYEVAGLRVIQVVNFQKHQSPHHTERASELPAIPAGCLITVDPPLGLRGNPPDSLIPDSLIPDSNTPLPPKGEAATAAPVLLGAQGRKPRKPKTRVVATDLKPESVAYFHEVWNLSPPEMSQQIEQFPGKWISQRISVERGSQSRGERNFQAIVDSGLATPRELYAAWYLYAQYTLKAQKYPFQHVSTFFGPDKATWREWLDRGRQAIEAQDAHAEVA